MSKELIVTPFYKPHAKQVLLHNAPIAIEDIWIILFGGAKGGGKSAGILADAFLFCQTYPNAKCCILRESLDAVKQSFLDKLPTLFPQEVDGIKLYEYREKSSSWYPSRAIVFPNKSYITLQRVANYAEARAKQGWEFHYLAIDEVTKQEERTVDYLISCVRSADVLNPYTNKRMSIPTKIVFGCNPGGIGHKWVKDRFITPTVTQYDDNNTPVQTKDVVEFVENPMRPGETIKRYIRFIPALARDNPNLNSAYMANLMCQPEHTKMMDMYGSWHVVAGKMFNLKDTQIVRPYVIAKDLARYENQVEIFVSIDWGYKPSYHAAHWHAVFADHRVVTFKELYGQELVFEDFVKEVARLSEGMYISATCLPHDMFRRGDRYRDDTGKNIGETKSDVFDHHRLNPIGVESGKGKVHLRFDKIHSATSIVNPDGIYKFRITSDCEMLIEELNNAVHDEINPNELAKACKDHALDSYGLFLVYYSDDIEPIGAEHKVEENKSFLQLKLEEDERLLEEREEQENYISTDDLFDY